MNMGLDLRGYLEGGERKEGKGMCGIFSKWYPMYKKRINWITNTTIYEKAL